MFSITNTTWIKAPLYNGGSVLFTPDRLVAATSVLDNGKQSCRICVEGGDGVQQYHVNLTIDELQGLICETPTT